MRTLRIGGEYADGHIRRHGKKAIWYFLGCIAVVAVFFFVGPEWVGLIGLLAVFVKFGSAYDRWENWFLGKRGELAVRRALEGLPDDYVALNDLLLPKSWGNIDHVVIGPNGLFVIETKNYSSDVKCQGDKWFLNGKPTKSLSSPAKTNAWHLRNYLESIFLEHKVKPPFIEPVLVFVKHRHRLDLNDRTLTVLKETELVDFLRNYRPKSYEYLARIRSGQSCFSPELTRAIVHHLHSLHPHQTQQRQLSTRTVETSA
jgi:hypothetical protein